MLSSIVKSPTISANELNKYLESICLWAYQWKMQFNPDISKLATEVLFLHKKKPTAHPPLFFNGNIVCQANEHKHLGIILDKNLSFKSHINEKLKKTKRSLE